MMFAKILFPTDFSDVSYKALDYIKWLGEAGTKEVVVLHVIDQRDFQQPDLLLPEDSIDDEGPMSTSDLYGNAPTAECAQDLEGDVRKRLAEIEGVLKPSGFKVKTRIEIGLPLREILRVEEMENVSLIVLGSHGKSNIEEMLLGSVSEKVVRKCKKPVLIIKRGGAG